MAYIQQPTYYTARTRAQDAFLTSLGGNQYHAQGLLHHTYSDLKRLSGDLPIVGQSSQQEEGRNISFVTQTFAEAQAWGWYELAMGVFFLMGERPGSGLVHFKRAWKIWRPWSNRAEEEGERYEATCERVRAGLWLGEAWARFMSDRAQQNADAVFRATLSELEHTNTEQILQETVQQQRQLPPASPGTPSYQADAQIVPYILRLVGTSSRKNVDLN